MYRPRLRAGAAAVAVVAVLAVSATACGGTTDQADSTPSVSATPTASQSSRLPHLKLPKGLPKGLPTSLQDLEKWKKGDWKNWKDWAQVAHKAEAFANPVIRDLWNVTRMVGAKPMTPDQVPASVGHDKGMTDPQPAPVRAAALPAPYHVGEGVMGKVFVDTPEGSAECSGTVVTDPEHPGKSNLVWTAGHCVHRGASGGWYRNITFVPSFNDNALPLNQVKTAPKADVAPHGVWWADAADTSSQWISTGEETGGAGSPYDYAVLHVKPENGARSLQETVGGALPVWFNAPSASGLSSLTAYGYPAAPPFDGTKLYDCADRPGRLSLETSAPTEYRIGCTMTPGSSGGGWVAKQPSGQPALVSNTSIGPQDSTWLAGPYLGANAKKVFDAMEKVVK